MRSRPASKKARPSAQSRSGVAGPRLDKLWEEIMACSHLLRREAGGILETQGVFLSEYRALRVLEYGPCTLGQVGRQLGLTPATLTTLARGLEHRGWAKQTPSKVDGRASLLEITPSGIRTLRQAQRVANLHLKKFEKALPPTGRGRLARDLQQLRLALEKAEDEEG